MIQATTLIPASTASTIASAAKAGGTNIKEASAPVFPTASWTVSNTGTESINCCPPLPGGTPATRFAPYSADLSAW